MWVSVLLIIFSLSGGKEAEQRYTGTVHYKTQKECMADTSALIAAALKSSDNAKIVSFTCTIDNRPGTFAA